MRTEDWLNLNTSTVTSSSQQVVWVGDPVVTGGTTTGPNTGNVWISPFPMTNVTPPPVLSPIVDPEVLKAEIRKQLKEEVREEVRKELGLGEVKDSDGLLCKGRKFRDN